MLKFTGEGQDGKRIYFLGVSRANIDRLTAGQPIKVELREMEGPDVTIGIIFGETEEMLFNALKANGLIPPEVKFKQAESGTIEKVLIRRGKPVSEK